MKRPARGFSLLELLLALAVGLVLTLGVSQVAISARITQASQQAAMVLQDDARFVLGKLIQDIRLAGMFGCQATAFIENAPLAFDRPISWGAAGNARSLTLVTAYIAEGGGRPDWTVLSDCSGAAQAYSGASPPAAPGQIQFAIRQLTYTFESGQLKVSTPAAPARAVLVDNVQAFDFSFGVAAMPGSTHVVRYDPSPPDESLIRSVRILLTLQDPTGRVKNQTWSVVAALRNRLG
ncbi:prepilin-type N-terminal cleavage/methylation domain-containing protein [Pseudomonas fildesensis]|uniref:Pilus assembly protein PilW n=1 Tax=Pseudomonas fildesensis TaxID=1674920 RepID=A0A0J8G3F0_9PSED|nr:prepilin-type N-terminal cleavage/methylation domain-containing protein [Pseudomonas fildesensis]KMT55228.1 pilus assembly protein PilW [Pseudomonas fildesensis]